MSINHLKEDGTKLLKTLSLDTFVYYKPMKSSFSDERYIRIEVCDTDENLKTVFNLSIDNINELLNNL